MSRKAIRQNIAALQERLKNASDFIEPWRFFRDELVELAGFLDEGEPAKNPDLTGTLTAVSARLLGKEVPLEQKAFVHIKDARFWHGTFMVGTRIAIFFYFGETDTGLVGMKRSFADPNIELVRFSLFQMPDGAMPARGGGQA